MGLPVPTSSELRFAARVDYFATQAEAVTFAQAKRAEGFNVNGGGSIDNPGMNALLGYPVHWIDRKGEGWYG